MQPAAANIGSFRMLAPSHRDRDYEIWHAQATSGRPVTMILLSAQAAQDRRSRGAFAEAAAWASTGAEPELRVLAGDPFAATPWIALIPDGQGQGVARFLDRLISGPPVEASMTMRIPSVTAVPGDAGATKMPADTDNGTEPPASSASRPVPSVPPTVAQPPPSPPRPAPPRVAPPTPAQPTPAQPTPAQPAPARPAPARPTPTQPAPAQPRQAPAPPRWAGTPPPPSMPHPASARREPVRTYGAPAPDGPRPERTDQRQRVLRGALVAALVLAIAAAIAVWIWAASAGTSAAGLPADQLPADQVPATTTSDG